MSVRRLTIVQLFRSPEMIEPVVTTLLVHVRIGEIALHRVR